MISKLIQSLFNTERCLVFCGGDQFTAYFGLSPRVPAGDANTIAIPEHCSATVNEKEELVVSCCREYQVNGKYLQISTTFGREGTVVSFRQVSHSLNYALEPTQNNIDGMIYIMERLRICKGFVASEIETNESVFEEWKEVVNGGLIENRIRSLHCKNLLSFSAKVDHCQVCMKKAARTKKRETSNLQLGTHAVKVAKTLNNEMEKQVTEEGATASNTIKAETSTLSDKNSQMIDELLSSGAPEKLKLLLKMQLTNSKTDLEKHQRKWDPEFISFCLNIYVKSPRIYRELRNSEMLVLPSESLLRMYKNCIRQKPGLNDENLIWMNKEAQRQKISDFGRRGGLVIDEMSIQDDLQIVRKGDAWSIVGGVDMGETNNMISVINNNGKKVELATHSLQFIFHGLNGFRWPVAYYGSNPATTHQIFINFWECVDALDEHGFTVDYVMLDGAATNRAFMNMLLGGNARAAKYITKDIYNIEHQVFVIQDSKHVIKRIRNSIEASKLANKSSPGRHLTIFDKPVVWEHFEAAYAFNTQSGFRIHRYLTKEHIDLTSTSKMRNRLAEQVLDKDMLFLMKSYQATLDDPERLSSTIDLLHNTSVLVDIFRDTRPITDPNDARLNQLGEVLKFFSDWENSVNESVQYTPTKHLLPQETRDDINSTILGFSSLCRALVGQGDSITPAYVNSDVVENHFCQQRGTCNGLNTNPTLAQYGPSNTSICLSQTSVSSKSNASTKALNFKATTPCPLNKRRTKNVSC